MWLTGKVREVIHSMKESFLITLLPFDAKLVVRRGQMILDAAIEQEVNVPYSCRNGTCRTCLVHVLAGEVMQEHQEECLISEEELAMNRRLICLSTAKSDAVLLVNTNRKKPKGRKVDEQHG